MESHMNIGIAGAGLIGRLLAWRLLRAGHVVTLYDADRADGEQAAARVAAAMLAPYSEIAVSERAVFDWGLEGLSLWPRLLDELRADSGTEVFYQQAGSVVVAHAADRSTLQHFHRLLQHRVADRLDQVRPLDRPGLAELEPELAERFDGGLWLAEEGTLDNRELLTALEHAIRKHGGEWRESTPVRRVETGALLLDDGRIDVELAIDARGVGAKPQQPELRGVRGEVLWVHAPEVKLSRPVRLMHPRYQLYIAPKQGDVYVIGATEIESESRSPITVRSSLELLSALYSVHTGFAEAHVLHAYANLRPAFSDNMPRIAAGPGLLQVNGLHRHGYLLAPWMLREALAAIDLPLFAALPTESIT